MDEFRRDLDENLSAIRASREALLECVNKLSDADLGSTRRGGWSIQNVLRHVIDSEVAYTKVLGALRSTPVELPNAGDEDIGSTSAVVAALDRVRGQLTSVLNGVDEATFYELRALGREQYSVISVLENVASHDHEHLEQIVKTIASRER